MMDGGCYWKWINRGITLLIDASAHHNIRSDVSWVFPVVAEMLAVCFPCYSMVVVVH